MRSCRGAPWRNALMAAALGALAGCASAPPEPEVAAPTAPVLSEAQRWAQQQAAVQAMQDWEVRGKVAYRLPEDAGSASLVWTQADGDSDLRLSGPLGVGSTRVSRDGALIRVRRDGIERSYPADAAPWLPNGTLLPIPVDAIAYWLRGVPAPGRAVDELELHDGRASSIRQAGWAITIQDYDASTAPPLPTRLVFEAPAAGLTLRMIVREWTVNENGSAQTVDLPPAEAVGLSSAAQHR